MGTHGCRCQEGCAGQSTHRAVRARRWAWRGAGNAQTFPPSSGVVQGWEPALPGLCCAIFLREGGAAFGDHCAEVHARDLTPVGDTCGGAALQGALWLFPHAPGLSCRAARIKWGLRAFG